MQDDEVVEAIVAGDPDGFADAYDRYAAPLFAYCSFMLPAPDDAAGAVRDTFLIAVSRLERLRDPNKLRPWLHAVARNECLRRLSATGDAPRPQKAAADGVLPPAELPASLRGEVLRACADNTPAGRADRASVAHHAGTFGPTGFPKAIGSSAPPWWRRRPRAAVAVAAVVTVAVAGALLAMLTGGGPHRAQASIVANGGGAPGAPASPGAWSTPAASSTPGGPGTSPGRPPVSPAPGQPTPLVTALRGITSPASPVSQRTTPAPSASPSQTSASPSASASPSVSPSVGPGVLKATPDELVLTSAEGKTVSGKFLLTAVGGPVGHYVIRIPPGLAGKVAVAPAQGSLRAGGWVTVTVTVTSKGALTAHLTIDPGNLTVTVVLKV
jgi:hypothetical protein